MNSDIIKRAKKVYSRERLERFIVLSQELILRYEAMINSDNCIRLYSEYAGEGICPICEQAGLYTRSCKSCSIFVITGKLCSESRSYNDLGMIVLKEVKLNSARNILLKRVEIHRFIIENLKLLKEYL